MRLSPSYTSGYTRLETIFFPEFCLYTSKYEAVLDPSNTLDGRVLIVQKLLVVIVILIERRPLGLTGAKI